jgi:hypothetical protein
VSLLKNPLKAKIFKISLLFMGLSLSVHGQQKTGLKKITFDPNLDSELFHSSDSILNPLTILTDNGVYDGVPDSTWYEVQSTCTVNGNEFRTMRFADYESIHDGMNIRIYETNPVFHQVLEIDIRGDKFEITFEFIQTRPQEISDITIIEKALTLKQVPSDSSHVLGRVYFKGHCVIDGKDEIIEIAGDFKAKRK